MQTLESALSRLQSLIDSDTDARTWRWRVRQELSGLREVLEADHFRSLDGWLAARSRNNERDRIRLTARIVALGPAVLDRLDEAAARLEVSRLVADAEHYVQKVHDLVYDSVSLEIGGSE